MSKKTIPIIAGIIINMALIIGVWFVYDGTIPQPQDIEAKVEPVKSVDKNIFNSDIVSKISGRGRHGELPVEVKAEELKKENPFN